MGRGVRRTLPEVLESEGRIVAISLAKSTQPFGTGAAAQNMGERAVSRDIKKVYVTVGDVFASLPDSGEGDARQFWKLIQAGRYDAGSAILSKADLRYGKSKVNLVGYGKSAWAAIARELGGTRGLRGPKLPSGERDITANWITRKGGSHRIARDYANQARPVLTLTSTVRYGDHILSASARSQAIRIAHERIIKQCKMAARYEAQQATRRAA